jgi:hypothetical protein
MFNVDGWTCKDESIDNKINVDTAMGAHYLPTHII